VIEVHALGLEDEVEVLSADVSEASEHAVSAVQRLYHIMFTEHHVIKDCAIWGEISCLDLMSVDWLVGWAEVKSLVHRTLTQEQFTKVAVIVIEVLMFRHR